MKLNYKRTLLVGFAFFLICTFWQAYDTVIPKILTDHFGLPQAISGIIMALDNILALFLLPFFGSLSDKTHTRIGKRKPFILIGTIVAVAAFVMLSLADASQLSRIDEVSKINDPAAMSVIYQAEKDETITTPDGDKIVLSDIYPTEESFTSIQSSIKVCTISSGDILITLKDGTQQSIGSAFKTHLVSNDGTVFYYRDSQYLDTEIQETIVVDGKSISLTELYVSGTPEAASVSAFKESTNSVYTNHVVPARQAYIHKLTLSNPSGIIWFMVILMVVLVAMSTFRSPAVALMPDVTIKPNRSKANAVINLMGTLGGIIVLVLGMGFAFNNSAISNTFRSYFAFFLTIGVIMLVALVIFMVTVKENRWVQEQEDASEKLHLNVSEEDQSGNKKLSKKELTSLILILASVVLWFFGYNAVTSKYSVYATNVLDLDYSTTLLIANAAAIVSYIPVGMIASKVGRKKTILAGVCMLAAAFFAGSFMRVGSSSMIMNCVFALAGIGWATINVNSFPMVVELSKGSDIGKYTGYYYAASMGAQALTPFFSGLLMDQLGMTVLFPYATVFVALAFVTMCFVKHGDSKPISKKTVLENFDVDDG